MARRRWMGGLLLAGLAAAPAGAAPALDRPLRTQTLKGAAGGEATCTIYPDLAVRVGGTDTPSPDDAVLLRAGKGPPGCAAGRQAGATLRTGGYGFVGRRGPYLLFEEADPNGSIAFSVLDARTGRTLIDDVTEEGLDASAHALTATPDSLRLAFRRALNTDCSLLARPGPCWAAITRDPRNGVPPAIARLGPPAQACQRSYRAGGVPRDDPSIIAYEVTVTWTRGRPLDVRAAGPVGCTPLP